MKQFSTILNIVLLLAVGWLYYLHFSASKATKPAAGNTAGAKDAVGKVVAHGNIAYIDIDSLNENYAYFKTQKEGFEKLQKAGTAELEEKQKKMQQRYLQLQQKAPTMTPQEQEAASNEMQGLDKEIQERKKDLENELFKYSSNMKENVFKRVQTFLKEYNSDKKFDYVLSYEPAFMFYKDSTLDITREVINGLNGQNKKKDQ